MPIAAQVSQLAIAALVCKKVDTDYLLAYDSRIDCRSAEYASYSIFSWLMLVLWPIGCPLLLLLLLKSYKVPEMATRKRREAELKAFMLHTLAIAEVSEADLKTLVAMATLGEHESATEPDELAITEDTTTESAEPPAEPAATQAAATDLVAPEAAANDPAADRAELAATEAAAIESAELASAKPAVPDAIESADVAAVSTEAAAPTELSSAEPTALPEHDRSSVGSHSTFEGMSLLQLRAIGRAHEIDGFSTLSAASLAEQLAARMKELIVSEEVVIPLLLWDENSTNLVEQRAVKHLDILIGAYASPYWWCELLDQWATSRTTEMSTSIVKPSTVVV